MKHSFHESFRTPFDRTLRAAMHASRNVTILRVSLAVVFVWFGALKLFDASPASSLVAETIGALSFGILGPRAAVDGVGTFECAIGVGFLLRSADRITIPLMLIHMAGTYTPFVLCPMRVFVRTPLALTLEGQYIVKNVVLVAAALVIAERSRRAREIAANPVAVIEGVPVTQRR